jgi:hypothetical protein
MQQPIEIDVEEDEQVVARVAGIDVAEASGTVCTRCRPSRALGGGSPRCGRWWRTPGRCWNWLIT